MKRGSNKVNNVFKGIKVEQCVVCVLVIVLVVLVVYYVNKNNEGFNSEKPTLYFFYVDWCGYCKKAKPKVTEMENDSEITNKVNIKRINCSEDVVTEEDKALANEYKVDGYPTFKFKGKPNEELTNNIDALKGIISGL
jgi:thiol-disulfide isomerase/thioredoxin